MATAPSRQPAEAKKQNNSLRNFQGVNTQAARQVIGDDQFSWLENVQPVGFGNMPALNGPSAVLLAWPTTVYRMKSVNLAGTDYMVGLGSNGAIYLANLGTNAVTTIGAAATLSGANSDVAQWQNSEILIVDPTKGYFSYDAINGLVNWVGVMGAVSVTTIGTGYTSVPTIGYTGGGGTGFAISLSISIGLATVTVGGTGYNVGDLVTISGGSFTTAAVLKVSAITTGGVISGINLVSVGQYTTAPTNPAASTSPYGTGATFTLNFGLGPVSITTAGSGYTSAPTIGLTGGGGTGGVVTASLAVVPSGGTAIATYAGYVWVSSNRTIAFSAPNSYNNFSTANDGGSFIVVDETLHSTITSLTTANDFLYVSGTSSFNIIGNVSVVSSTANNITTGATVFSNTNLSSSIGTSQQYSVIPYFRGLWFAAPYGFFVLYGSTTQKGSDDLDGIFPLITSAIPVTAGLAVLNKVLTLCFMFQYNDPVNGPRSLIACFANKKWFFASQGTNLNQIETAIISGTPILYATDGLNLYSLFTNASSAVTQTVQTKLWDMGDPLANKQAIKFGLEVINPIAPQNISGTIDTELQTGSYAFSMAGGNLINWLNNSGTIVQWQNSSGYTVSWPSSGYAFIPQDVETVGRYIGVTLSDSSAGTVYAGLHLQYIMRTQWAEGGAQ